MLRVNPVNRQELLKRLTFHPKSLVFKTVSVPPVLETGNSPPAPQKYSGDLYHASSRDIYLFLMLVSPALALVNY